MGWLRTNAWRLLGVLALLPAYFVAETWQDFQARERRFDQISTVADGTVVRGGGHTWRLDQLRVDVPPRDATGKPVDLPKDTRLVVARVSHKGPSLGCDIRLRDDRGRYWTRSTLAATRVHLAAPDRCPYDGSPDAPKPGAWGQLEVPFVVPKDARGLS
ncbi:MAG TPA: hypothetical protein VI076_07340, partial [Actinopolymorphaceae bacterium]